MLCFFISSRRRHTRCALVTGGQRVLFRSRRTSSTQPFSREREKVPGGRMRARAQRAALALLQSGNRNQDQELSRRDGASHLSLLVQRNLAQRNTPRLRARCCAPGSRSRRDFPRGHPAPAENAAHPCAAPCGSCPPSPPLRRGPQGQDQKPKPKPKPKAKAKAKALSPANL